MSYIETKAVNAFVIFIIVFLIIMTMLFYFKYQPYIKVYGEIDNEYVNIYLTDQEISNLNYKLKYKDQIISYEIVEVTNDYVVHEDKMKRNLKLKFDYDKSEYILELYLAFGEETSIWEYFYYKYMKGVI